MDEFSYKTIASPVGEVILKEKGSKFIGYAFPVCSENDVKGKLDIIRNEHPKATHHCYAYRLGKNGDLYRANDDGEPSGSAGLPIYNQLLSNDITDILVIVVRYYGGTKLGVAGLIKAYRETAKEVLSQTEEIIKKEVFLLKITSAYEKQGVMYQLINQFDGKMMSTNQHEKSQTTVSFLMEQKKDISELISEMPDIEFEFL